MKVRKILMAETPRRRRRRRRICEVYHAVIAKYKLQPALTQRCPFLRVRMLQI
jgi:hypothetical protein